MDHRSVAAIRGHEGKLPLGRRLSVAASDVVVAERPHTAGVTLIVDYVEIDGQRANIGVGASKYPDYFEIDSISLLLGRNGAGKTRLLLNVAEVLTRGTRFGDQGNWAARFPDGRDLASDARNPPPGVGVVYYTALPYRRLIGAHPRFVDAGSLPEGTFRSSMFEQYGRICEALGEPSGLIGRLSYRKDVIRRMVVPFILENECELSRGSLNRLVRTSTEGSSSVSNELFEAVVDWIEERLEELGGAVKLVSLATLEFQAQQLRQRFYAIRAFLEGFGLASFPSAQTEKERRQSERVRAAAQQIIANTREAATSFRKWRQIGDDQFEGIEFDMSDGATMANALLSETAFEVKWTNLSSGFQSLIHQFARFEFSLRRLSLRKDVTSVVFLIDEGDAYLHLDWQRQYVEHLNRYLASLKSRYGFEAMQAVIASHSPIISGDFPSSMVQRLGSDSEENFKTFGSSLDALVLEAFETSSIGSFAAQKIQDLHTRHLAGELNDRDHALIEEIGDESLRRAVLTNPNSKES